MITDSWSDVTSSLLGLIDYNADACSAYLKAQFNILFSSNAYQWTAEARRNLDFDAAIFMGRLPYMGLAPANLEPDEPSPTVGGCYRYRAPYGLFFLFTMSGMSKSTVLKYSAQAAEILCSTLARHEDYGESIEILEYGYAIPRAVNPEGVVGGAWVSFEVPLTRKWSTWND